MKTIVRYVREGTVYVQNGEYTLHFFDKKKTVRCCKHGTRDRGEGGALIFTDNSQGDKGVYCMACLMEFLDREIGRIN